MSIDRRSRRDRQCDRVHKAAEVREARRQRIEAEEERLEFLDVCFNLLDAIEAYNDALCASAEADEEEVSGSAFALALQTEP